MDSQEVKASTSCFGVRKKDTVQYCMCTGSEGMVCDGNAGS